MPCHDPAAVATFAKEIEGITQTLGRTLRLDEGRLLSWAFAQAVLSVLRDIEDGFAPDGLRELERQMDDAARTQRWVRIDVTTLRRMVETGNSPFADELSGLLSSALYAARSM